eukprot:TRINITY_DN12487_c0_g1_i1.p1 TRINITY_DN12487_c0_g1~~TRINITY_DN12487_c0_g1_i1.p1  ORF type:complete len:383 (+),score=52.60 TRINITY_DN12487_c0_g1_i1:129-1277(+)
MAFFVTLPRSSETALLHLRKDQKRVLLWSMWARNFFCWLLPAVIVFCILTFIIGAFWVVPVKKVLEQDPETSCYVFNNTRALRDSDNSSLWFVDYVFVGYNLSSNGTTNETHNLSFEYYSIFTECVGSQNDTCDYYHPAGTWTTCIYNPKNYTDVTSESQAEYNVADAVKTMRYVPIINSVVVILAFLVGILSTVCCCGKNKVSYFIQPRDRPEGFIHVEGLDQIESPTHQMAVVCILEQQQRNVLASENSAATNKKAFPMTKQLVKLEGVTGVVKGDFQRRKLIFALVLLAYVMLMVGEWAIGFLDPTFVFFLIFSLAGTLFFLGLWIFILATVCLFYDNVHLGYEVVTDTGVTITMTGGFFFKGLFGVTYDVKKTSSWYV